MHFAVILTLTVRRSIVNCAPYISYVSVRKYGFDYTREFRSISQLH